MNNNLKLNKHAQNNFKLLYVTIALEWSRVITHKNIFNKATLLLSTNSCHLLNIYRQVSPVMMHQELSSLP